MQVYEGVVRNQVIVIPKGVYLDEGSRVEIRVPETDQGLTEGSYRRRLVEVGLMAEIRGPVPPATDGDRTPIQVAGRPLSQTIIADRR